MKSNLPPCRAEKISSQLADF